MKRFYYVFLALLAAVLFSPLHSEDDYNVFYRNLYKNALRDLRSGSAEERIASARLLGSHLKQEYVHALGIELNKELETFEKDPYRLRLLPVNDPVVKTNIAWALGNLRHKAAIGHLFSALAKTTAILDEEIKLNADSRKKLEGTSYEKIKIILDRTKPGPALMKEGHSGVASPDMNWSISDEFKEIMAPDYSDEGQRIRMMGYNYMNLAITILAAIGEVSEQYLAYDSGRDPRPFSVELNKTVVDGLTPYLTNPYPFIRSAAALTFGKVGTISAIAVLENRYKDEQDPMVKVSISHSILYNDKRKSLYRNELIKFLGDTDRNVRLEAAHVLARIATGESYVQLVEAYKIEPDKYVRAAISEAIYNAKMDNILPVNY